MIRSRTIRPAILAMAALITLLACSSTLDPEDRVVEDGDAVRGTGAIVFQNFEGGFHSIRGDNGRHYLPITESAAWTDYRRMVEEEPDGFRVRFTGTLVADKYLSFVPGVPVDLDWIRPRKR